MKKIIYFVLSVIFGILGLKQKIDFFSTNKYGYLFTEEYELAKMINNENPYISLFRENLPHWLIYIYFGIALLFLFLATDFLKTKDV